MGIMSGAVIHPIAIPMGCIIGALVGFWFNEIKSAVRGNLQKVASVLKTDIDFGFALSRAQSFGVGVHRWTRYHKLTWMRDVRKATKLGYWCISVLGWLILSPFRLINLCFSHPVMVARTIRALSIVCTTVLVLLVSYSVCPDMDEIGRYMLVLTCSGLATMLSFFAAEVLMCDDESSRLSFFFFNWSRYSRQGPVLQVVKSVAQHLLAMVTIVGLLLAMVFVLCGGFVSLVLFIFVTLLMNALWIASSRHEHLLCVTVTLIVTVISAIVCNTYMHGIGLWLVALTTGVLSGLLTEALRRVVVFSFNNTVLYKFLGDEFCDPNRPEELKFGVTKWRVWTWAENLFYSLAQKIFSVMLA
jgi:hypothetical protein